MPAYDPRIDAYIEMSAEFARPVLNHLRELVHEVCPEVTETIKWSMPHFEYKGVMCGFAAFKHHCSFGFWKAALLNDPEKVLRITEKAAMGSFGKIASLAELPPDRTLKALIRDAMRLNEEGIKVAPAERKAGGSKPAIEEPAYLTTLLDESPAAKAVWNAFPPSHRREYLEWITEAKTEATREKRLLQMLQQLEEGKHRNWKYTAKK